MQSQVKPTGVPENVWETLLEILQNDFVKINWRLLGDTTEGFLKTRTFFFRRIFLVGSFHIFHAVVVDRMKNKKVTTTSLTREAL